MTDRTFYGPCYLCNKNVYADKKWQYVREKGFRHLECHEVHFKIRGQCQHCEKDVIAGVHKRISDAGKYWHLECHKEHRKQQAAINAENESKCVLCLEYILEGQSTQVVTRNQQRIQAHTTCANDPNRCKYKECRRLIHADQTSENNMHTACAAAQSRKQDHEDIQDSDNASCYYTCDECKNGFDHHTDWCYDNGRYLCQDCNYETLELGPCAGTGCSKVLMEADPYFFRYDGCIFCQECMDEHIDFDTEKKANTRRKTFFSIPP